MISSIRVYKNEIQSILNKYLSSEGIEIDDEVFHQIKYCYSVRGTTRIIKLNETQACFNVNDIKNIIKVKHVKTGLLYYFNIDDYIDSSNVKFSRGKYSLYYKGERNILADHMFDYYSLFSVIGDLLDRYDCDKGDFVRYCMFEGVDSDHRGFESIFNDLYKKDCAEIQKNFKDTIDNIKFYYDKDINSEYKKLFKFFECNDGKTLPAMLIDFDNYKVYFPSIGSRGRTGRKEFDINNIDSNLISPPNTYVNGCIKCEKISNDYYLEDCY